MASGRLLSKRIDARGDAWNIACGVGEPNCPETPVPIMTLARLRSCEPCPVAAAYSSPARSRRRCAPSINKNGEMLWMKQVGPAGRWAASIGIAADDAAVYVPLDVSFGADLLAGNRVRPPAADCSRIDSPMEPDSGTRRPWPAATPDCSPAIAGRHRDAGSGLLGTIDGMLRAYSSDDGRVLWELDTVRGFRPSTASKPRRDPDGAAR